MRRVTALMRGVIVFIATLPAVLTGCTQRDPSSDSGRRAAFDGSAIAANDLPEVVITAPRAQSKTIVLSVRGAAGTEPR
jgi:hypothetical protein